MNWELEAQHPLPLSLQCRFQRRLELHLLAQQILFPVISLPRTNTQVSFLRQETNESPTQLLCKHKTEGPTMSQQVGSHRFTLSMCCTRGLVTSDDSWRGHCSCLLLRWTSAVLSRFNVKQLRFWHGSSYFSHLFLSRMAYLSPFIRFPITEHYRM